MIGGDNGTELISNAVLAWCGEIGVKWHYIAPCWSMQNGYVESCNGCMLGRLKEEMLIEARLERHVSNQVPSLGRGLGKIVCSTVNASANQAS
tara:strand:+ start:2123 stop:2401 length:279 start_codon:yes stop_codon:yes gene_type:complete